MQGIDTKSMPSMLEPFFTQKKNKFTPENRQIGHKKRKDRLPPIIFQGWTVKFWGVLIDGVCIHDVIIIKMRAPSWWRSWRSSNLPTRHGEKTRQVSSFFTKDLCFSTFNLYLQLYLLMSEFCSNLTKTKLLFIDLPRFEFWFCRATLHHLQHHHDRFCRLSEQTHFERCNCPSKTIAINVGKDHVSST